jgi:hypothetical protein
MRKIHGSVLSLLLVPAIASAQSAGPPPPPPDDAPNVETARPQDGEPDLQPPAPPAQPPPRARNPDDDQVGILQQHSGDGVGILQGLSDDSAYQSRAAPPPPSSGQWVFTSQYGWVWMPYGRQYVDEGSYGADTPYQYVYTVRLGWTWCSAPWLWGWGAYPWFGRLGPYRFGWYRGLYRSGYGWGHYRGGYSRGVVHGGGYYRGGYPRGPGTYSRGAGAYHATRPIGGFGTRGNVAPPARRPVIQGTRGIYGAAPARGGSFSSRGSSGGNRGGAPHATAGSRGGGHRGR